ncbi:hypothetical protein EVAR_62342_1 [Eumeta japonica]|uniref:Uncharacterized protein n=1 Tax=Eumeta variegata TaxID=151549 RepID=A0A4C1ZMK3_EUMVA|nr:hypothetical protein EVAR_62342_1 [Eumeta japonica]
MRACGIAHAAPAPAVRRAAVTCWVYDSTGTNTSLLIYFNRLPDTSVSCQFASEAANGSLLTAFIIDRVKDILERYLNMFSEAQITTNVAEPCRGNLAVARKWTGSFCQIPHTRRKQT